MTSAIIARLIAFVLYLGFMIYLGLRYMDKNNSAEDFFLGGRHIGPWMSALSAEASDMSGWLMMGLPGVAYIGGMKEAFWTAVGLELGTYLNWLFVAKPLRRYTASCGNSITIPEFFTNRFKDDKHLISFVSVICILVFFTIYTASGFVACGKLINSVFGVPYVPALIIGMVVVLAYTLMGGYLAVCSTDFIQGTLMFVALVVTSIVLIAVLGGPFAAVEKVGLFAQSVGKDGKQFLNPFISGNGFGIMAIISALAWGLGYFGMPHILVRFMSLRSEKDVKASRRIAIIWVTIAFIGALVIGAFGTAYLVPPLAQGEQETVVIGVFKELFPAFIGGIFLCAILAAAMSTADSQLLVAASAFANDFYSDILHKGSSEKEIVWVSRITVLVIAAIAFAISLNPNSSIFGLVSYAWAGFGAAFGPLILLSLFWRKATRNGALSGIVVGAVTVVVWHSLKGVAPMFDLYEIIPGFVLCLIVAVVVSLCDKNKNPEMLAEFDAYKAIKD